MKKGKFNGFFEKMAVVEELARDFYLLQGCKAPDESVDYMGRSTHPQEMACYHMALKAVEKLMN